MGKVRLKVVVIRKMAEPYTMMAVNLQLDIIAQFVIIKLKMAVPYTTNAEKLF